MKKLYLAGVAFGLLLAAIGWMNIFNMQAPTLRASQNIQAPDQPVQTEGLKNVSFDLYQQSKDGKRTCLNENLQVSYETLDGADMDSRLQYPQGEFIIQARLPQSALKEKLFFNIQAQLADGMTKVQVFDQEGYIHLKRYRLGFEKEAPAPIADLLNQDMREENAGYHADFPNGKEIDDPFEGDQDGIFFLTVYGQDHRVQYIYQINFYIEPANSNTVSS